MKRNLYRCSYYIKKIFVENNNTIIKEYGREGTEAYSTYYSYL